jgi:hypothetical protein
MDDQIREGIKTDLESIRVKGMDLIHFAQDRIQWLVLVNTLISLRVP